MMRRATLIFLLLLVAFPAEAVFRWFWDHPPRRHRHLRPPVEENKVTPFAEPQTNCKEILEAKKQLGGPKGKKWTDQLDMLTDGQRANIAKCLKDADP